MDVLPDVALMSVMSAPSVVWMALFESASRDRSSTEAGMAPRPATPILLARVSAPLKLARDSWVLVRAISQCDPTACGHLQADSRGAGFSTGASKAMAAVVRSRIDLAP